MKQFVSKYKKNGCGGVGVGCGCGCVRVGCGGGFCIR